MSQSQQHQQHGTSAAEPEYLIALHDFDARSDDEISIRRGDHVLVLETDQGFNDGWFIGRNLSTRKAGMFPYAFTTKLVLPTPALLSSPAMQQPLSKFYQENGSEYSQQQLSKQPQQQIPNSYSVHDTLTDLDEAISELSGANQQQQQQQQHQANHNQNQQQIHQSQNRNISSSKPQSAPLEVPDIMNWQPADVKNYFLSLDYDPAVCECFLQHQITGPILLELDLAYLKEIDIPSFGTRFQISKVIKTLNQMVTTGIAQPILPSMPSTNASQQSLSQTENNNYKHTNSNNSNNNNDNPNLDSNGLMPAPVFKRQSLLRTAKDNTLLNHHLSKPSVTQEYQQRKNDDMLDFPLSNGTDSSVKSHMKNPSFDRSWTVSKGQKSADSAQNQHQRLRSTTIGTADQYYNENNNNNHDVSNPTSKHAKKPSYVQETRNRHGSSSHARQLSSDTLRGNSANNNNQSTTYNSTSNDGSTLFSSSHKHSHSASSLGFSDFKYLNKLTSDEAFNDDATPSVQQHRRPSSLASVILSGENGSGFRYNKNDPAAYERAVESDSDNEGDDNLAQRMGTDASVSNSSFDSSTASKTVSHRDSPKDGNSITPTNSLGKKKKTPLRSSSSHSNLRKPSSKKNKTSAFQEGIKSVTPTEAAKTADYSGWMCKRGSVAVGTWKARFFTLHGTRLSYFSQFSDTREKGLIDITSHRVVPVNEDDKLVAMYAASVGAGRHCFKIVPPSPGSRKGVTFTAPKVHYFAVDSKEEMREWMNAIIKATIDRDDSVPVVSSCATPTVSLARAREMFAESKVKEEELRAKAVAENSNNISQMALGSSITGNNSIVVLNSTGDTNRNNAGSTNSNNGNNNNGNSTTNASGQSWLNNFGSNFYHANNTDNSSIGNSVSSPNTGFAGNGNGSLMNGGTPSTPESPAHSGSLRSSETSSSITRGSSVNLNKQQPHSVSALGPLGQGFGSGSLGINPATLAGGNGNEAMNGNVNGGANSLSFKGSDSSSITHTGIPVTSGSSTTFDPIVRHGKFSTEYPTGPLPATVVASTTQNQGGHLSNMMQQQQQQQQQLRPNDGSDMDHLNKKTGGLRLVTDFD